MNLLFDPWIPIQRKNREVALIAPYELTTEYKANPIMHLYALRPDFKGALAQFLIGLLQTVVVISNIETSQWLDNPPDSQQLKAYFEPIRAAFEFINVVEKPAFMQDLTLTEGEIKSIANLFIEQPGENTLKENGDHFIKRNQIQSLCVPCAATALFTLQINAPSGGAGHRTSLRGGGPLTTLIVADCEEAQILWRQLIFNLINPDDFKKHYNQYVENQKIPEDIFPWLIPTRTSDITGKDTSIKEVHPLHMYWCMPRRIRYDQDKLQQGNCDICNAQAVSVLTEYRTKNYGINYIGVWEHPLTPYRCFKDKEPERLPLHPTAEGLVYKDWLGLLLDCGIDVTSGGILPARAIKEFCRWQERSMRYFKIWAFGYALDNAKALAWTESLLPFYNIPTPIQETFYEQVTCMVQGAAQILGYLRIALKKALVGNNNLSKEIIQEINQSFWAGTEKDFYKEIDELLNDFQLENANYEQLTELRVKWQNKLIEKVLKIFDLMTKPKWKEVKIIKRICKARIKLYKNLCGKKLRQILDLPEKLEKEVKIYEKTTV